MTNYVSKFARAVGREMRFLRAFADDMLLHPFRNSRVLVRGYDVYIEVYKNGDVISRINY